MTDDMMLQVESAIILNFKNTSSWDRPDWFNRLNHPFRSLQRYDVDEVWKNVLDLLTEIECWFELSPPQKRQLYYHVFELNQPESDNYSFATKPVNRDWYTGEFE